MSFCETTNETLSNTLDLPISFVLLVVNYNLKVNRDRESKLKLKH